MPLEFIVSSAKKNPLPRVQDFRFKNAPSYPGKIGASQPQQIQEEEEVSKDTNVYVNGEDVSSTQRRLRGRSTSINAIATEIESVAQVKNVPFRDISWEKCKCLKQEGNRLFCTKFTCLCVKNKCPKNIIEC